MAIDGLRALFANRVGVVATMHQKERAIAPLLQHEMGIIVQVPANFNTDQFGTFTREVKRPGDQLQTARLKAKAALELTGETLAIASEGSFGPHPAFPYIACNRELVVLIDQQQDLEIVGEALSTDTNYSHRLITNPAEAHEFAAKVGFPTHGLVVMADPATGVDLLSVKGITTPDDLTDAVRQTLLRSPNGKAQVETDMRAMYNPTRMTVIGQATRNLIQALNQRCPNCGCPGFDIVERKRGLPCALCGFPTELTCSALYHCKKCGLREDVLFPDGMKTADPAQCAYCNP